MAHLTHEDIEQYKKNTYKDVFEGVIDVSATWSSEENDAYLQGHPQTLRYKKPGENTEQTIYFTTFA